MVQINDAMKDFFGKQLPMIATVSNEGKPNIGPKRSMRILDDSTLIYNETACRQTLANIKDNGKVAVSLTDWEKLDGYRYVGKAEVFTEGEHFDACVEYAKEKKYPTPKAAVVIHVEEIYTLKIGPTAGTRLQ